MFVKTTCGCWWLHIGPHRLRLQECSDETSTTFLSLPEPVPNILEGAEYHTLDSPMGRAWLDRLSMLLMRGNQFYSLAREISSAYHADKNDYTPPRRFNGTPQPH